VTSQTALTKYKWPP